MNIQEIKNFFQKFRDKLEVKVCVFDKNEFYFLKYQGRPLEDSLMIVKTNLGRSAVDIFYDQDFESFVPLLVEDSKDILHEIKNDPENAIAWKPLYILARNILSRNETHPYYLPILKEIVNLYQDFQNGNGQQIPDACLEQLGCSFQSMKRDISKLLEMFDAHQDIQTVAHSALSSNILGVSSPLVMCTEKVPERIDPERKWGSLCLVLNPMKPEDIWFYLSPKYLESNLWFKRCENCRRYFVTTSQSNARFCEYILDGRGKSCRQLMPKVNLLLKSKEDPAEWLFNRAYKTMYSRVSSGNLTKASYKEWSKEARAKRNECSKGLLTPEEYSAWLCDSGLFIDYLKDM